VSTGAENELLRLLAPMKRDIVEPPAPPRPEGKPAPAAADTGEPSAASEP
jgi:hypothetical protein